MYPRVKRIEYDDHIEFSQSFFTKKYGIKFDYEKCIGCGLCIKVCPNHVITSPDLSDKVRIKTEDLKPEILDITKCSFCGTCAYICPLSVITLKKDNQQVDLNEMGIVTKNVVPKLKFEIVKSKKFQADIKKYFEGDISVDWNKCVSCMSCVEVCPVSAFSKLKKDDLKNSKTRRVSFEKEKCIACGTCARACNAKAITFSLKKLNFIGEFKERFWNSLITRIRTQS